MADKKKKNGNVVDLTADDEAEVSEGGGKKKKPAKAPKPPKAQKSAKPTPEPKGKSADKSKKGGKGSAGVIFILILLVILGGFIFEEIKFNYLGVRDIVVDAVVKLDPDYKPIEEKAAELEGIEAELDKREKNIASKEKQIEDKQSQLDEREAALEAREDELTPIYRLPLNEKDLEDMNSLGRTYAGMDPESAATILASLYDVQDTAAILYYMSERNAAAILAVMKVDLAAEITEILLRK